MEVDGFAVIAELGCAVGYLFFFFCFLFFGEPVEVVVEVDFVTGGVFVFEGCAAGVGVDDFAFLFVEYPIAFLGADDVFGISGAASEGDVFNVGGDCDGGGFFPLDDDGGLLSSPCGGFAVLCGAAEA